MLLQKVDPPPSQLHPTLSSFCSTIPNPNLTVSTLHNTPYTRVKVSDVREQLVARLTSTNLIGFEVCKSSQISMTREASAFLAAVKWDEEAYEPREFIQVHSLPQVAKSIKCRSVLKKYPEESLAVPMNQPILWLNVTRSTRIVAQPVKFRNNLPPVSCGGKISLDHNFPGWFEILSEDGCTSKCMETIGEVAKKKPETFLIRQKVKCILAANPEMSVLLQVGEILTFVTTQRIPGSNHYFVRCLTQSGNNDWKSRCEKC